MTGQRTGALKPPQCRCGHARGSHLCVAENVPGPCRHCACNGYRVPNPDRHTGDTFSVRLTDSELFDWLNSRAAQTGQSRNAIVQGLIAAERKRLAVLCYYADKKLRPRCEGTAVVRYGSIALCGACDSERSTVGKGTRGVPVNESR